MKTQGQIIKATVDGRYMRGVIARKGWTKQQAADKVVEFLLQRGDVSLYTFMEAQ